MAEAGVRDWLVGSYMKQHTVISNGQRFAELENDEGKKWKETIKREKGWGCDGGGMEETWRMTSPPTGGEG